jgi:hypothetical protein
MPKAPTGTGMSQRQPQMRVCTFHTWFTTQQSHRRVACALFNGHCRWSNQTKALYEILLVWAGPRVTSLLQLNLGGPAVETIRKGLRNEVSTRWWLGALSTCKPYLTVQYAAHVHA